MDNHLPPEALDDPFGPPKENKPVTCLHCGEVYDSYRIEWREFPDGEGKQGFWCCPIEDCDGRGYGIDIYPVDGQIEGDDGEIVGGWFDDDGNPMPPP